MMQFIGRIDKIKKNIVQYKFKCRWIKGRYKDRSKIDRRIDRLKHMCILIYIYIDINKRGVLPSLQLRLSARW